MDRMELFKLPQIVVIGQCDPADCGEFFGFHTDNGRCSLRRTPCCSSCGFPAVRNYHQSFLPSWKVFLNQFIFLDYSKSSSDFESSDDDQLPFKMELLNYDFRKEFR